MRVNVILNMHNLSPPAHILPVVRLSLPDQVARA
jgi:hypothetical protein